MKPVERAKSIEGGDFPDAGDPKIGLPVAQAPLTLEELSLLHA
jgi:hypothetical protein